MFTFIINFNCVLNIKADSEKCNSPDQCKDILDTTATGFLGSRYSYGSTGKNGFDCSGFVITLCKSILGNKISLPRSSQAMYESIKTAIPLEKAKRGDLLFFKTGRGISHVAMYWGKDKTGNDLMCHASSSKGVELRAFKKDSYWNSRLIGIKRVNSLFQTLYGDKLLTSEEVSEEDGI